MPNEMITQLPTVSTAMMSDVIYAVQGYLSTSSPGLSVQETLQQVYNLFQANIILYYAGNPNGNVAGTTYQFCWDTTNSTLFICTSSGAASTAVWTEVSSSGSSPVTPTDGGTGVSNPTAHTLPVAEGSSNFNFLGPLTNGQLLIGSTGVDPVPAALTAGSNISITNGAGTITIATTGIPGVSWTNVTGTTASMVADGGYVAANSGAVTLTLPTTAAFGTILYIQGLGSGGTGSWSIAQNNLQSIIIGSSQSTTGTGGSVSSTNTYDSLVLLCVVANTTWASLGGPQSAGLTIV